MTNSKFTARTEMEQPSLTPAHEDTDSNDPRLWSVEEVARWLRQCAPKGSIPVEFEENCIDGATMTECLTYEILHRDLGIKAGPALVVIRFIQNLRTEWNIAAVDPNATTTATAYSVVSTPPSSSDGWEDDCVPSILSMVPGGDQPVCPRRVSLLSTAFIGISCSDESEVESDKDLSAMGIIQNGLIAETTGRDSTRREYQRCEPEQQSNAATTGDDSSCDMSISGGSSILPDVEMSQVEPALDPDADMAGSSLTDRVPVATASVAFQPPTQPADDPTSAATVYTETSATAEEPTSMIAEEAPKSDAAEVTPAVSPDTTKAPFATAVSLQEEVQTEVVEEQGDAHMAGTEPLSSPPPPTQKTKRRVAPNLVSAELPANSSGNIPQDPFGDERSDAHKPACPLLPPEQMRAALQSAFPGNRRFFRRSLSTGLPPLANHTVRRSMTNAHTKLQIHEPSYCHLDTDTFWFRRFSVARLTAENVLQRQSRPPGLLDSDALSKLWNKMILLQVWQRQHSGKCDTVLYGDLEEGEIPPMAASDQTSATGDADVALPLYGDSDDSGEFSDGLLREIANEVAEDAARKAKAEKAKAKRVALVGSVIAEMEALYAQGWEKSKKPKFEARSYYLWGKYIARREHLHRELLDLKNRRLPKARESIISSGVSTRPQAKVLCEGLRSTIDQIAENSWLLELTAVPRPLRPSPRPRRSKQPGPSKQRRLSDSESDGTGTEEMSEFIDDDDAEEGEMLEIFVEIETNRRLSGSHSGSRAKRRGVPLSSKARSRFAKRTREGLVNADVGNKKPRRLAVSDILEHAKWQPDNKWAKPVVSGDETQPQMARNAFNETLVSIPAEDLYSAAVFYIDRMAVGGVPLADIAAGRASLSATAGSYVGSEQRQQKPNIDMRVALRAWAEFLSWLVSRKPSVRVKYPTIKDRNSAHAKLLEMLKGDSGSPAPQGFGARTQQRVCSEYSHVADSLVKCEPPIYSRRMLVGTAEPPHLFPEAVPQDDPVLVFSCGVMPGIVLSLQDGGVAKRAAFADFCRWKRDEIRHLRENPSLTDDSGSDEHMSVDSRLSCEEVKLADISPGAASGTKRSKQARREPSEYRATDSSDLEIIGTKPAAKNKQTAPSSSETPSRKGRRNVRAIREENPLVLEMRRKQQAAESDIKRRLQKSTPNTGVGRGLCAPALDEATPTGEIASRNAARRGIAAVNMDLIGTPVLINPGHLESERDVMIPGFIAGHLKDHQVEGIRFMWKNAVMLSDHSADALKEPSSSNGRSARLSLQHGCVLAHSMGLGKTLQTISFIYTLLNEIHSGNPDFASSAFAARRVLILCPPTVQSNWASEFWKWTGVDHNMSGLRKQMAVDGPLLPPPFNLPVDRRLAPEEHKKLLEVLRHVRQQSRKIVTQVINYSMMKTMSMRLAALKSWSNHGGVLIMGYSGFRELMHMVTTFAPNAYRRVSMPADLSSAVQAAGIEEGQALPAGSDDSSAALSLKDGDKVKYASEFKKYLLDDGPCLIIADEGHNIKNPKTQLASLANMLKSKSRICLTGYPLQNNLEEYWTMVDFCFPNYLGDLSDFRNAYINPIKNGMYADSTSADKRVSTIRMKTLQRLLETLVDRRDSSVLHHQLPRKVEYIISCPLTPLQMELYTAYLAGFVSLELASGASDLEASTRMNSYSANTRLFQHGAMLLTICNHPSVCLAAIKEQQRQIEMQNGLERPSSASKGGHGAGHARPPTPADDSDAAAGSIGEMLGVASGDLIGLAAEELDSTSFAGGVGQRSVKDEWCKPIFDRHMEQAPLEGAVEKQQVVDLKLPTHSTKAMLVLQIIRKSAQAGERVLVFSRSIPTLDYLQWMVEAAGVAAGPNKTGAASSKTTLRIDGQTPVNSRQGLIDKFNAPSSPYYVFFISSGTGSIGINLVAASRVILYDIGWNPLYDEQAVARAYRYGQRRRVYVYRLLTTGTWEDRLFNNNVFKVGMTRRVVDKQSMGRRISKEDMQRYLERPPADPMHISKEQALQLAADYSDDVVFADLLASYKHVLSKVTPHATLVANEDDNFMQEDQEILNALVLSEKRRLGQVPASVQAQSAQPGSPATSPAWALPRSRQQQHVNQPALPTSPVAVTAAYNANVFGSDMSRRPNAPRGAGENGASTHARPQTGQTPTLRQPTNAHASGPIINIRRVPVVVAEAILLAIKMRLRVLSGFTTESEVRTHSTVVSLIQQWLDSVSQFINKGSPGYEQREQTPTESILGRIFDAGAFCKIVPQLYSMDNATLDAVVRNSVSAYQ